MTADTGIADGGNGPPQDAQETLKYQLLGPSLTKAGQDTVDQQKVSEIIYNASKGSKFFNYEEVRDRNLTEKIRQILAQKHQLERQDLRRELRRADDYLAKRESTRDLTQTVVHIDCDAFYAAVEELDRPELKEVPMAVGKGVLTTCNYHARKYGCRSGMASFVAMKLCPQLICLPLSFNKYTAKANEVREILVHYDARFESASIDEAYLNITKYCEDHQMDPDMAIAQLRQEVAEKTKITISAGIAPNARLAKIASNKNKPNGQYRVANNRAAIMAFMRDLPVRKLNGVGRVCERELDAIGIKSCGDIFDQRALVAKLFGDKVFQFLMNCYLGLGRTSIHPAEEYERKSVGTESTFGNLSGTSSLREQLRRTAEELSKDLARTQFKGRTLVLKIKLHTYEVLTRQTVIPKAINGMDDIYQYALPMLTKLGRELPGLKLRLMGLRLTNLVSTKPAGTDFFGVRALSPGVPNNKRTSVAIADDGAEWEVWPDDEMDDDTALEDAAGFNEDQTNHTPVSPIEEHRSKRHGKEITPNPKKGGPAQTVQQWKCPICQRPQAANDKEFNNHVDFCLSRQTIKEAVTDSSKPTPAPYKEITFRGQASPARSSKRMKFVQATLE